MDFKSFYVYILIRNWHFFYWIAKLLIMLGVNLLIKSGNEISNEISGET